MAMLGMQADNRSSYFPGYYSARDLNLNASCSILPLNNADKIVKNGNYCNFNLSSLSLEQHLACKETLKQTMLQHEAVFREQICELHRLYNRQRQLMNEVERNKFYRHHLRLRTSQSNSIMPPFPKTSQVAALLWLNPSCNQARASAAEINPSDISYDKGKTSQVGHETAQTDVYLKKSEPLESRCKKVGNKILDLELPADEYIDSDDEETLLGIKVQQVLEVPSYPLKNVYEHKQKSDGEWLIDIRDLNLVFTEDDMTHAPLSRKCTGLADLNEPIEQEKSEEVDPEIDNVATHVANRRKMSCQDMSETTNPEIQVQPNEVIQNAQTHGEPEACSNNPNLEMNKSQQDLTDWQSKNDESGESSGDLNSFPEGNSVKRFSTSSEEIEIEQAHEVSMSNPLDHSSGELQSKGQAFGLESADDDYPILVAKAWKHSSDELVPLAGVTNYGSSSISSLRKHTRAFVRAPIAVRALPCFENSAGLRGNAKDGSPGVAGGNSQHSKKIKSSREVHCLEVQSNFYNKEAEFESADTCTERRIKGLGDLKCMRDIDLNSMSPCSSSDAGESVWITDRENKCKDSDSTGLVHIGNSNQKRKRAAMEADALCLQATRMSIMDDRLNKLGANDTGVVERLLGICTCDPYKSNDECSSHGFVHSIHEISSGDDNAKLSERDGVVDCNFDCNSVTESGEQLTAREVVVDNMHEKKILRFGSSIDLNSCISEDDSSPPTCSVTTERDLEALVSPKANESFPVSVESDRNEVETFSQLSGQENRELLEELVMVAAEAIVSISSRVPTCQEGATFRPSEASQIGPLYWFSRIANSVVDDPESEFGVALSCKDSAHGIDYFEAMTLQLKETQMEEYCCKSDVQKEEATHPTSFANQPRKGRTRRGRQQRKDFQSEILPSLASLSRYEVTEDLHAIGGLIDAAHGGWSAGARKGGRNGCTRRRRNSVSPSNVENVASTQPKPKTRNGEVSIEKSLVDWGTITRRRRGQRYPASNPRLILAQV